MLGTGVRHQSFFTENRKTAWGVKYSPSAQPGQLLVSFWLARSGPKASLTDQYTRYYVFWKDTSANRTRLARIVEDTNLHPAPAFSSTSAEAQPNH